MSSAAVALPAVAPPTTVLPTPSPLPGLNNLTTQQRATFVQSHHEAFQAGRVSTYVSAGSVTTVTGSAATTQVAPQAASRAGTADQVQQSLAPAGVGINVSQSA